MFESIYRVDGIRYVVLESSIVSSIVEDADAGDIVLVKEDVGEGIVIVVS